MVAVALKKKRRHDWPESACRADTSSTVTRIPRALERGLGQVRERLTAQARLLEGLGFEQVLARGFVLVRDGHGTPLVSAAEAKPGMAIELTFHDGARAASIEGSAGKKAPKKKAQPEKGQGDLF